MFFFWVRNLGYEVNLRKKLLLRQSVPKRFTLINFPLSTQQDFQKIFVLSRRRTAYRYESLEFLVACYATLHPALSVRRSIRPSVRHTLLFLLFCGLRPHYSCPNDEVTSNMAPCPPARDWDSRLSGLVFSEWRKSS